MSNSPNPLPDATQLRAQLGDRLLVLFDGHCALCHASVRWLLRHDHHDRLRFSPADSALAQAILTQTIPAQTIPYSTTTSSSHLNNIASAAPNTILVLTPATPGQPRILTRSTAILACLVELDPPWPQLAALARLIPLPLRDAAYRLVALLRYRLARRYTTCPLPAPQDRPHFLKQE